MNETECENLIKSVKWTDPSNLISLAILEFINVLVIGGNLLVIAAVFCSNKLRSVTNFFIVNLAVADLLVGLAVLPFSATWEVFKVWIFGDVWCRIWLAVDVWMCTASILNLCAISLDRYVAVTRPVTYPSIMSKKRAKSLIAGIWVLSFVICFPPLVGWKDQKTTVQPLTYTEGNHTLFYAAKATIKTTSIFSTTLTPWTDTNGEKLYEKKKDNNYGFSTNAAAKASNRLRIRTPVTTSANTNDHNTYNPNYVHQQQQIVNDAVATDEGEKHTKTKPFIVYYDTSVPPAAATAQYSEENVFETLPDNSDDNENRILVKTTTTCPWICELTNDRGYVLYSALGSFYIPMFVMLFFYWRIYRAAVRTTRAINQGFKTTKGAKGIGTRFDEERLTLRIHRGRGSSMAQDSVNSNGSTNSVSTTLGTPSPERFSKYASRRYHQSHDKIKISVSYPSSENISEITQEAQSTLSSCSNNMLLAMHYNLPGERGTTENQLYRGSVSSNYQVQVGKTIPDIMCRPSDLEEQHSPQYQQQQLSAAGRANKKMGKRNIKAQVKRFRMETKAAKTLAIIVGLFIICWLPFFTMYIIRPFCEDCIDPLLFSILFWLGYCNSAVNPMIYALFSKDFRFAFKSIICRCFCSKQMKRETLKTSRRDSDMSTIRIRVRTPSITPSAAMHSFGENSELQQSEIGHEPR